MRRGILSLLTLILLATGLLAPTAAFAGDEVSINDLPPREESRTARARFVKFGRCSRTGMTVVANLANHNQDVFHDGNQATFIKSLRFFMFRENLCTGEEVVSIEAGATVTSIKIAQTYGGATVKATMVARDFRNDVDVSVTFDLIWRSAGPLQIDETVERIIVDSNGTPLEMERTVTDFSRQARAFGTITVGNEVFTLQAADEETKMFEFKVNTEMVQ